LDLYSAGNLDDWLVVVSVDHLDEKWAVKRVVWKVGKKGL
jgi:hypothetical protein